MSPSDGLNLVGLSAFQHDAAAAVIVGGRVAAFAEEERFSRVKHTGSFPTGALSWCLGAAGVEPAALSAVAFYMDPRIVLRRFLLEAPMSLVRTGPGALVRRVLWTAAFFWQLQELGRRLPQGLTIEWVPHHRAHATYAFFLADWDEATVVTMDSIGEYTTAAVHHGRGVHLTLVDRTVGNNSLGYLYGAITEHLGYRRGDGEGTVMALASYGRADPRAVAELIHVRPDGTFVVNQAFVNPRFSSSRGERLKDSFRRRFGTARRPGERLHQGHADLAATLQAATEAAVVAFVARAMRLTRCRRVCLGGGVALNSVANHEVRLRATPADLFVGPAANDAGSALGAAMDLYSSRTGLRPAIEERVYLGPQFDDQEVCRAFARVGVSNHQKLDDPAAAAARLLSAGNIIGWFQGRMETGPRALGNRSILADPRNADVRKRINEEIKGRENFRPFAPVVLEEYQDEWFEPSGVASPHMLEVLRARRAKADLIPAVVHIDGTARVQTLRTDDNPLLARLVGAFYAMTGVPIVLNTSFNAKGEPIVATPIDALRCFWSTGLDVLIIGSFLLVKP